MERMREGKKYIVVSFLCGALLLTVFATIQKISIGAPLVLKGYVVPIGFGGLTGVLVGSYLSVLKSYNELLEQRINNLEKFLPICSICKKIRKPNSDPYIQESWEEVDAYIAQKTSSRFSHSVCPACRKIHYDS